MCLFKHSSWFGSNSALAVRISSEKVNRHQETLFGQDESKLALVRELVHLNLNLCFHPAKDRTVQLSAKCDLNSCNLFCKMGWASYSVYMC